MPIVRFETSEDEEKMIDELKPVFNTTTRAKVFRGSLKKAYELFKDVKVK